MADMIERIQQCALCEDAVATLGYETQHFNYGPGADGIVVEAIVPVWTCAGCGEQFDAQRFPTPLAGLTGSRG